MLLVGFYEFVDMGGLAEVASSRRFEPSSLMRMFAPDRYRLTLIAALVALIFAVLDIQCLWWRVETQNPNEPQPRDNPLGYLAMRARRYFLVLFVVSYLAVVEQTIGLKTLGMIPVFLFKHLPYFFLALFLLARRPNNWSPIDAMSAALRMIAEGLRSFANSGRE